jgi:ribosomal protein S17
MIRIEKKAWPELFQKILNGEKTFDVRLADFNCKKGDILILREWDPKTKKYTGRKIEKKVAFILKTKTAKNFGLRKK